MKNYSHEIFVKQLRLIKFPDYSSYTFVNDVYQDFVTKFLSVIDFVAPIRTLRVKSNTRTWLDMDVLNTSRNRHKHYKKLERSGKEIYKSKINYANL